MNQPRKFITGILLCFAASSSGFAALNVEQFEPYEFGGDVRVENTLTNNTGVELASATLDYSNLLFDVANLSYNVARFDLNADNVVDFGADNLVSQMSSYLDFSVLSTGDVSTGWFGNIGSDGIVDLGHGPSFEPYSTNSDMDIRLILDNFLLTDPATSTIVPISLSSTETITDFATADDLNINTATFTADGFAYEVVPVITPRITNFEYDPSTDTLNFTWLSNADATYTIHYSNDLTSPFENILQADISSAGASTQFGPVPSPSANASKLFFTITESLP